MNTNKRKSKIAGEIFGLIFIAGILLHCVLVMTLGNRVKNQISQIKAKGEFVTLADLRGPKIPDSKNGAVVYKKAFSALAHPTRQHEKIFDGLLRADKYQPVVDWNKAAKSIEASKNALPLLEEAVLKPECRFPVDWEKGLKADFPHFDKLKQLVKLTAATAVLRARDGRVDEALNLIDLTFKMNKSLENEPSLLSQIVRIRLIEIGSDGLQQVMIYSNLNDEQWRSLDNTLSSIDTVPGYIKGLEGERTIHLAMYRYLYRTMHSDPNNPKNNGIPRPIIVADGKWKSFMAASVRHYDELQYLQVTNKYIEASRVPYRIAKSKNLFPRPSDVPKLAVMSRFVVTIYDSGFARDYPVAELNGSRICLALTAYRNKFDAYPVSLSELRKGLDWKLPEDPFSGKDFIYKRNGSGFMLYSIGPNLKDDGGKITGRKRSGDIVWEMKR